VGSQWACVWFRSRRAPVRWPPLDRSDREIRGEAGGKETKRERKRARDRETAKRYGGTERIAFTQRSFLPPPDRESPSTRLDSNSLVAITERQTEERRRSADTFERKDEETVRERERARARERKKYCERKKEREMARARSASETRIRWRGWELTLGETERQPAYTGLCVYAGKVRKEGEKERERDSAFDDVHPWTAGETLLPMSGKRSLWPHDRAPTLKNNIPRVAKIVYAKTNFAGITERNEI